MSTERIRLFYTTATAWNNDPNKKQHLRDLEEAQQMEFDAWLLTVQAEAWDASAEAHKEGISTSGWHKWPENPYRQKEETDGE